MAASSLTHRRASGVVVGVDTHKDLHVARAKDELGRGLGEITIPASAKGYRALLAWSRGLGEVRAFGVEGSGCYGAGLARHLRAHGEVVIEVIRPNRQARRLRGKSDPADAEAAASAVLSGEASGTPKASDAAVEMIRALRVARSTANRARTQAINALHALVVTAPEELRADLRGLPGPRLVRTCARLRPGPLTDPVGATKAALRSLARRHQALSVEVRELDGELCRLTAKACPALLGIFGAGSDTAGALLLAAGDNPERLRSEAAFAKLTGVSPVQASSGKTMRHRLNRGGDRHANAALHRIVLVRLRWRHPPTIDYVARRTAEGRSKREIIRCLKRYVAREVYRALTDVSADASSPA
jgi:transposase